MVPANDSETDDSQVLDALEAAEEKQRMNLEVKVDTRGACQRHVTVTIPREDIDRYLDKAYSDLMPKVTVPGFRPGRAPRKLVESRFRKEVCDDVKGSLLLDSMTQVTDEQKLAIISDPNLNPGAVEIPEEGSLTFEFDLEVRPEFELPNWKGLSVERPVREFTEQDVQRQMENVLGQHGRLVPKEGPAAAGDYLVCKLSFLHGEEVISSSDEEVIRIRPVLSFRDGRIEKFDKLMKGVRAGETRDAQARLSADAPNQALRGQEVTARFEIHDVKQLKLPEVTPSLLETLGGFDTEQELRDAVKASLERRLNYQQQQRARQQVLRALTVAANWELPPDLLRRQSARELERAVLELRRSGFSESEIRAHENEIRQNSQMSTARALKEHFILERIAEEESIEALPDDYDQEVELIAEQMNHTPRRVRAQLEKGGQMDALRNQIIERKAIELILSHATFKDVPYQLESTDAEALDQAAGGEEEETEIPEAQFADPTPAQPRQTPERS